MACRVDCRTTESQLVQHSDMHATERYLEAVAEIGTPENRPIFVMLGWNRICGSELIGDGDSVTDRDDGIDVLALLLGLFCDRDCFGISIGGGGCCTSYCGKYWWV